MPRASVTGSLVDPGVSDALEWIAGDMATLPGTFYRDDAEEESFDLAGYTITLKVEFYTAKVTVDRSGSSPVLKVSKMALDPARPATAEIACPVKVAAAGTFSIPLPANLLPGDDPPADTTTPPVGLAYLTRAGNGERRTDRFLIIFRRGAPS